MAKKTILIEDREYDLTDFQHPGGGLINYYTEGQDATDAFNEFHYHSKKAKLVLKSLPSKVIKRNVENDQEMLEDFAKFRKSLEDRGYFKPNYIHITWRAMELVVLYLFATYMIKYNTIAAILLFGLCSGRSGWIQHEGGHSSLSTNIKIDKQIQNFFIGFFMFGDGSMWNSMHNKHHAAPQKIGYDIDLNTAPLVAFHNDKTEAQTSTGIAKLWLKYQAYTFLPITSGILVMPFWSFYLHPKKTIRDKNLTQAIYIITGHTVRVLLFMKFHPTTIGYAILYHLLSIWVSGIYLFGHFSLSHTFTPTVDKDDNPNWVRYAIEHTVDISPQNDFVCWFMGYLNNQVIHHLFPSMPQFRGKEVSKELIGFCKKWDIKYNIVSYFDAWYYMLHNLEKVGHDISIG